MTGKKAARAAPMSALAARSLCSASSTSGRRSSTDEAKLDGSGAMTCSARGTAGGRFRFSKLPNSKDRALAARTASCSCWASAAWAEAAAPRACSSSSTEAWPERSRFSIKA